MKIYIENNYEQMSLRAADIVLEQLKKNPASTLGLATGDTVLGLYNKLILEYEANRISFKDVKSVNLDEYIGLSPEDSNSYNYYMSENFFRHINIDVNHTFVPNGMAANQQVECEKYEKNIETLGGIDLQVLGIGVNGHIGFNEPGTPVDSMTHVVELGESTRQSNARFFPALEDVPTHAVTMGIKTIMRSKQIILLASGKNKAEAIQRLVEGKVDPESPASILQLHPNASIIVDQDAGSLLAKK
ncbi:glucosamine-6-phosphate deaminase [bacterium LRH843]|nr:glucosamine-6-phosphate deaminase [bacterium LRH843]